MLDNVELNDPSQLEVAAVVSGKMAAKDGGSADDTSSTASVNNSTSDGSNSTDNEKFPRTAIEQALYDETIVKTATSFKLLTFAGMKYLERAKSLSKRYVILHKLSSHFKMIFKIGVLEMHQ